MKKTSLPTPTTIKKIIKENHLTKTFVLNIKVKAQPGQFIMVWLPRLAEKPFSLTDSNPLTFTVRKLGKFTNYLNSKTKAGETIYYRGPFGKGTFKNTQGKKIFVSGGCGCGPLYFFSKTLKSKKTTQIILGAQNKKELLFVNRFKKLGFKTKVCTDDGSQGFKGFTTDLLEKILQKEKISCVYACGPMPMLRKIHKLCKTYKIKYQLSLETLMKCGFGVCGSCAIGNKLVCEDGPVFSRWPKENKS